MNGQKFPKGKEQTNTNRNTEKNRNYDNQKYGLGGAYAPK